MASSYELCHLRCELSILSARDLDAQPFCNLFIRCYASTGEGRRVRVDSRVTTSSRHSRCKPLAVLEYQGDADHMSELLEKHGVAFELRRRKAALSLFSQLSSSKLVGKTSAAWRDLLVSGETSAERWITFDTGSCGSQKPPAVLIGVKIRLPEQAGVAGRRAARTAELEECRCRHCEWNLDEEAKFALATSVVVH